MAKVPMWRRYLRFSGADVSDDLRAELEFHIEELTERYVEQGLTPSQAKAAALHKFGDVDRVRAECLRIDEAWERSKRRRGIFDALWHDFGYALRGLRRSPAFSLVAVLTLALGIGANTAIFAVVYHALIRPLPFREPGAVVLVLTRPEHSGALTLRGFSGRELDDWDARAESFEAIALCRLTQFAVDAETGYEPLRGVWVSERYFDTFGDALLLGVGFGDRRAPEAVISYRLWQRLFEGVPDVVGRGVRLNGDMHTVVGVTRPDFDLLPDRPVPTIVDLADRSGPRDVWVPFGQRRTDDDPSRRPYHMVARLNPGVTIEHAQVEVDAISASLDGPSASARREPLVVMPMSDYLVGAIRRPLWLLLGAVGVVLLVATANVTGLLLARQTSRARELVVRQALGAPRMRLLLHALSESTWLSIGGGLMGVILAGWIVRVVQWLEPVGVPRLSAMGVDAVVLLFSLGALSAAALLAGLTSAVPLLRRSPPRWGWAQSQSLAQFQHNRRFRSAVVAAQLALSVVLVVGAVLLHKSFARLLDVDLGVDTDRVLSVQINLAMGRDLDDDARVALTERVIDRVAQIPGVRAVGVANGLPPDQTRSVLTFEDEAATLGPPRQHRLTMLNPTPGYFDALNIRLRRGRLFSERDAADADAVLILPVSTARRLFGGLDVVGCTLPSAGAFRPTIVGLVDDVRYGGLEAPASLAAYAPFSQWPFQHMNLVVRTSGDPLAVASAVRDAVHEVDREIMVASANTLDDLVSAAVANPRFRTAAMAAFALLALSMTCLGLGGAIAYSVAQRTAEIAVRMTLGAKRSAVLALVMREWLFVTVVGGSLGLLTAWASTRYLGSMLFEVAPTDVVSFITAAALVLVVTLASACLPARRAISVEPMIALRAE